ncbi:hypothetical protein EDC36_104141 [Tepidimonas ignava]|uniref:Restriction endonuclease n=2 Tax=Tepidimonas ignava TaxID=114249 RepID=A0A4V2UW91_9BURK|nr:hypothetical protein EDC36_104141 [Tepidimonas ignava]TSE20356.1 hypothetical protein Tigna_01987 [Tepidimonas ignava]
MDDGMDDFEEETRRAIESFLIQNGAKRIISFGSGITKYGRDGRVEMSCGPAIMDDRRIIVIHYAKRLKNANVDWHIEQLMRFRQFFPEHAGKALHGAVGGMVVPEEVQRYAEQQGLYVLTQVDGVVMIKNQPDFVAKTW